MATSSTPNPRAKSTASVSSAAVPASVTPSFDQAMTELESLVRRIEAGELSLEDSLLAYQRGASLVQSCRATLESVEQQVSVLEGDLLRPMSGGANADISAQFGLDKLE